ncbi:hypothetical protein P8917_09040 [Bacillus atrophaeus]|uniref:hypothetical protein n=1 Tax=Bacillus atrophaeus TaxID=1452 RepID=UPI002280C00F|nr:hypothetical protein [Bacillus atrophaeus]MCY8499612.1 hypothetical protein [Bacillus atrophaeus]MCY8814986.1 hypothetical protein [Bacillus atrophaeus]MCY8823036.1 hypothetical protein [Bacillus atrophaeus]MCY8831248.1 hypothetical protein [Bacillus atrophaeus]MCY8834867.1 hypothetical protein [Bacillus atrophaeus]
MSMMVEHMTKIFRTVIDDKPLNRLLYYKDDPLSPSLPDVQTLDNYYDPVDDSSSIMKTIIKRAPKTDDLINTPICRLCIYLGNAIPKPSNQSIMLLNQDLMIDVYTHINTYEETEFRNLKITDRICEMLFNQNFAGIGKSVKYTRLLISNAPDGYLGYKLIFTFGAMK